MFRAHACLLTKPGPFHLCWRAAGFCRLTFIRYLQEKGLTRLEQFRAEMVCAVYESEGTSAAEELMGSSLPSIIHRAFAEVRQGIGFVREEGLQRMLNKLCCMYEREGTVLCCCNAMLISSFAGWLGC